MPFCTTDFEILENRRYGAGEIVSKGSCGDCSATEGSTMRAKHVTSTGRRAPSVGTTRTMPRDKEPPFRQLLDLGLESGCFLGPMAAVAHRWLLF